MQRSKAPPTRIGTIKDFARRAPRHEVGEWRGRGGYISPSRPADALGSRAHVAKGYVARVPYSRASQGGRAASRPARHMGHCRFYELDPPTTSGLAAPSNAVSNAEAHRAARALLERLAAVEVWRNNQCVALLSSEARRLWGQTRRRWMSGRV